MEMDLDQDTQPSSSRVVSSRSSMSKSSSCSSLSNSFEADATPRPRLRRIAGGYRCNHCKATFDLPSDLRHHERKHIPKNDRPHGCADCSERFLYPKDLARHVRRKHPYVTRDEQACEALSAPDSEADQSTTLYHQVTVSSGILEHLHLLATSSMPSARFSTNQVATGLPPPDPSTVLQSAIDRIHELEHRNNKLSTELQSIGILYRHHKICTSCGYAEVQHEHCHVPCPRLARKWLQGIEALFRRKKKSSIPDVATFGAMGRLADELARL